MILNIVIKNHFYIILQSRVIIIVFELLQNLSNLIFNLLGFCNFYMRNNTVQAEEMCAST